MLRYLNGIENIKDYVVKFYTYIFLAEEKDQIKFYDGHKLLKFSQRPTIVKKNAWDFRRLPCLLISASDADLLTIGLEKDFLGDTVSYIVGTDSPGPTGTDFYEAGGEISLSMTIDIYAYTLEERDKLTDLVSVYMSGPTAKDYFMRHYIRLPNTVRVSEGGATQLPNIDTPVYYNTVRFNAVGAWRDREYYGAKLSQLLFNLEFVQSINVKPKLLSVALLDSTTVRLTFDLPMEDDAQLTAATNYVFDGTTILTAQGVSIVSSTVVDVVFSGALTSARTYRVSAYNLSSTDGVGIDTVSNSAAFVVP